MEYFLERIARSLKNEFGNTLNRHCLVFPGRRAGLYFLKHMATGLEKPVWVPAIYTINELFRSYSLLQPGGSEVLLFELYSVYSGLRKDPPSFDDFYFWGDMLINDFDDTDKYLADAPRLFANIMDLREIDQRFGGLTDDQKEVVKRFWMNLDISKLTDQKSGFLSMWSVLPELYSGFRKALREKNLAYEGMIFRDIAETPAEKLTADTSWDMVHFIGFNALNECEKRLMKVLSVSGKARFYWDYDNSYIGSGQYNSAGFFMRSNLETFGNDMPDDWDYNTTLSVASGDVKRVVIETSSDVTQVKIVPELLSKIPGLNAENAHETAVILSDENLLVPMLSSLPEEYPDINITMGYPLRQSLVYTLFRHLMDLQGAAVSLDGMNRFYPGHVRNILRHPLITSILTDKDAAFSAELLNNNRAWYPESIFTNAGVPGMIFRKCQDPASLSTWFREILSLVALNTGGSGNGNDSMQVNIRNEFIYRIVLSLNRLESVVKNPSYTFSNTTYIKILEKMLRGQSVPFSGEPLSGIQIMGILETRALDFKNLIILSVNEGVMPAVSSSSSFIPFSLRQAFGLPSVNHQESIYAYHFYRLLHRAENVIFTYNSNSEGLRSGEMSRFLIQMNYNEVLRPVFSNLDFEIRTPSAPDEVIERTDDHTRLLNERFFSEGKQKILSPSAINTWLGCRMKFYYMYVNGLRQPERLSEEIDPAMFGNILHDIMKRLYTPYGRGILTKEIFDELGRNEELLRLTINDSIIELFRKGVQGPVTGNELIIRDALLAYVRKILQFDSESAPIEILHMEEYFSFKLDVTSGGRTIKVNTGGIADRIDKTGGIIRLVDYKTGNVALSVCSVNDLFEEDRKKDIDGLLQILVYCEAFMANTGGIPLRPSVYRIRKLNGSGSDRFILKEGRSETPVEDYRNIRDQFVSGLKEVISDIFNPSEPFTMTREANQKCQYCPYSILCMR